MITVSTVNLLITLICEYNVYTRLNCILFKLARNLEEIVTSINKVSYLLPEL